MGDFDSLPASERLPEANGRRSDAPPQADLPENPEEFPSALRLSPATRERIRLTTAQGGLRVVPPDFEDWETVHADEPFTVLYLDPDQPASLSPELARNNAELVAGFWKQKVDLLQKGAAGGAILTRFGGPLKSQQLVLSTTLKVQKAADALATLEAIESALTAFHERRKRAGYARLAMNLRLVLLDGLLDRPETDALFSDGAANLLREEEVADFLYARLTRDQFIPIGEPAGDTLTRRLRSVSWATKGWQSPVRAETRPSTAGKVAPPETEEERRGRLQIAVWKQRLLDLSRRNRALNFKAQKVSTVTVVDEQPAEVFRHLCVERAAMRFKPASRATARTSTDADGSLGIVYTPYDRANADARHVDDVLQCSGTIETLEHSLRRIEDQARVTQEEQGVNALFLALGILQYEAPDAPGEPYSAPLVLVPVALSRKSARTGFQVKATDEEPVVNPSLNEYLRVTHGLTLPELPDFTDGSTRDLQAFLRGVADAISGRSGWRVTNDIYLSLFAFQRLVMFKDLERNGTAFALHRLLQQLVNREGAGTIGLPDEIRGVDLDSVLATDKSHQVVDADGTQLRAIAAVAAGHDLVLEGPPGTGKSQTITNLIANALGRGQSVLFVAEKMAALEVVHSRLVDAGLGEFCLELHSTKANKRGVIQDIRAALDASIELQDVKHTVITDHSRARETLANYVDSLHSPFGILGLSPYEAYGELSAVLHAPVITLSGVEDALSRAQVNEIIRDLGDLASAAKPLGGVVRHPWRDAKGTFYTQSALDSVAMVSRKLLSALKEFRAAAVRVSEQLGLPTPVRLPDVSTVLGGTEVIQRSPGVPIEVLESSPEVASLQAARDIIDHGRKTAIKRRKLLTALSEECLAIDHAADIAYVENKTSGILSFMAALDSRYRDIRTRWRAYRISTASPSMRERAQELRDVGACQLDQERLRNMEDRARAYFGMHWKAEESDWASLSTLIEWVDTYRTAYPRFAFSRATSAIASHAAPDITAARDLGAIALTIETDLGALASVAHFAPEYFVGADTGGGIVVDLETRIGDLMAGVAKGPQWATYVAARNKLTGTMAEAVVAAVEHSELPYANAGDAFRRAFFQRWLDHAMSQRPALREFHSLTHERRLSEFRELDRQMLLENRVRLKGKLRNTLQARLREPVIASEMAHLRQEMTRQRNLSPLRRTMQLAEHAVRAIKPCFLMSPLSVSQYLEGRQPSFDLVIFDEASQLPSEAAIATIARGRQLVVVGDPRQLPPTNFFALAIGDRELSQSGETSELQDSESVLEDFMTAGVPNTRLRWHYRSAHESLIAFSNAQFYEGSLLTFPSVDVSSSELGIHFEFVKDGVYEGEGRNAVEACCVADAVVAHIRSKPDQSLGVGTFSMKQQLAIQDELELRRQEDPSLDAFLTKDRADPFFVKNLENIQGDERDAIFLSVTYGPGADGRVRHNFGPVNGPNGGRRLNVLTTRARKRMHVFSSMKSDDISVNATQSAGPRLLRDFLRHAETGGASAEETVAGPPSEEAFRAVVAAGLVERGYEVEMLVGTSGYRVDVAILDSSSPGGVLCGIETDGQAYARADTVCDRERLRYEVLERRGWTMIRAWSTQWMKDRASFFDQLVASVEHVRENRALIPALSLAKCEVPQPATSTNSEAESTDDGDMLAAATGIEQYVVASPLREHTGADLLEASIEDLSLEIANVVKTESPVHTDDVAARIASFWGTRLGSRISSHIKLGMRSASRLGLINTSGGFARADGVPIRARCRAGLRIPPERVAIEEYQEAIRLILRAAGPMDRDRIAGELRATLGIARNPAMLKACDIALHGLLNQGDIGEASTGFAVRR